MAVNPQNDDLHGVFMTEDAFERLVSAPTSYRYELIDGILYDMTGSSPEHGDIVGNIFSLIHAHLRKRGPCKVYQGITVSWWEKYTLSNFVFSYRSQRRKLKSW